MTKRELVEMLSTLEPSGFNKFLIEVKKAKAEGLVSTLDLQTMFGNAIEEKLSSCRAWGDKGAEITDQEKEILTMYAKIVAMDMMILHETRAYSQLSRMALLLLEYASYLINSSYDLSGAALKAASFRISELGFNWTNIENAVSVDMLVYKFCGSARFNETAPLDQIAVAGKGSATLDKGELKVSSSPVWETTVRAFATDEEKVSIETKNIRDQRLKASESENSAKLDEFMKAFLSNQTKAEKMTLSPIDNDLKNGDRRAICITSFDELEDGSFDIRGRVLGTDGIECIIEDEELIKGIYTGDLADYIFEDDCVMDAVMIDEDEIPVFSIRDAYKQFAKAVANEDGRKNKILEGRVVKLFKGATEEKNRVVWMTANGYGGLLKDDGIYKVGDKGFLTVRFADDTNGDLFINLDEAEIRLESETIPFSEEDVLFKRFTKSIDDAEEEIRNAHKVTNKPQDVAALTSIARIIARKRGVGAIERYKSLLASQAISLLADDACNLAYSQSRAEYLKHCLAFAQRITAKDDSASLNMLPEETRIIRVLSLIGEDSDLNDAKELVECIDESSAAGEIARLILAHHISKRQPDEVKFDGEQMRSRICSILGVSSQLVSLQQKGGGKYGKGELDNVEFKASYIMRNDGKGADMHYQGRGQVFEAVCGLLNKNGGTVYVGVNNYGDPITGAGFGIKGDLEWFEQNIDHVRSQKCHLMRHQINAPKDVDAYCLFLNDERDLYFKPSLKGYITISPTEDQDAIRITVRPSEFEIAILYEDNTWKKGQAFVRDGQETVPMTRVQQEQRLMDLRSVGKVEQFIVTLTEAIDKQHKVILKNYASSNSNEVKDRFVVPINLAYNDENLWAYDLDKKILREFRLARVQSIETDVESPSYPHSFKAEKADVFRWINPELDYHIKLKLSIAAYNNLMEEYSNTKNLPSTELYKVTDDTWILDTHLQGLGAVRRFYLGLADEIEILDTADAPALRADIQQFVEENVNGQ